MIYGRLQLYKNCKFDKNGIDLPVINADDVTQAYDGIMQYSGAQAVGTPVMLETPFNPAQKQIYFRSMNDDSGGDLNVTLAGIMSCNYLTVRVCVPSADGLGEEIKTYFYFVDSIEIAAVDEQPPNPVPPTFQPVDCVTIVANVTMDIWATDVLTKTGLDESLSGNTHIDGAQVERITPPNNSADNAMIPDGFYVGTSSFIYPSGMNDNSAEGVAPLLPLDFPLEIQPVKVQQLTTFAPDNTAGLTSSLYSVVAVVVFTGDTAGFFGNSVMALTTSTLLTAAQATAAVYTISSAKKITYSNEDGTTAFGIELKKLYIVPAVLTDGKTIPKDNSKNLSFVSLSLYAPVVRVNPVASTAQDVLSVKSYLTYRIGGLSAEANRQLSAFVLDADNRQYYTTIGTLYHRAKLPSSPELYPLSGEPRMLCVAPYVTLDVNGTGGGVCLKLWTDSENFVDITEDFSVDFPSNTASESGIQAGIQKAIQGLSGGVAVAGGVAQLFTGNPVGGISAIVSGAGAVVNAVSPEEKKNFGGGAGAGVINAFKAGGVYFETGRAGNADALKMEIGRRGYSCRGATYAHPIYFMKNAGRGDSFMFLQCRGGDLKWGDATNGNAIPQRGRDFIRSALERGARFWINLTQYQAADRGERLCNGGTV